MIYSYLCIVLLFLNDIAGSEILLILVFILIFFGSKSIPGIARTMGRAIRQVKDASDEIQREIKKSGDGMKKDLNLKGILEETAEDIKRPLDQMTTDIDEAVQYRPPNRHSHIQPPPPKVEEPAEEITQPTEENETPQDVNQEESPEVKKDPK